MKRNDRSTSAAAGQVPTAITLPESELTVDPALGALLRRVLVSTDEPAWGQLHARVVAQAEIPLARRRAGWRNLPGARSEMEWWELAARWARAAVPLAIAASAALILSLARQPESAFVIGWGVPSVGGALERVVSTSDVGDTDLLHALLGTSDGRWAIRGAYDRE